MSSRISRDTVALSPVHDEVLINKAPVVTKVIEQPLLAEVKEVKNLNVVHKDLVTEIHEQPIIEIARKPELVNIKESAIIEKAVAPVKLEEFGEVQHVDLNLNSGKPVEVTQQLGDVKHFNLKESVKSVEVHEHIERHIIPTITEVHEQKIVNVIEQPIIRTFHEAPIIREVPFVELVEERPLPEHVFDLNPEADMMRDSSLERERMLPSTQLSTHVLKSDLNKEVPSSLPSATLLPTLSTGLQQSSGLFSTQEFKNQVVNGDLLLQSARPLSSKTLAAELMAKKKLLNKSLYFSKPAFSGEFMAQKALLRPVANNLISEELSEMGQWKSNSWSSSLLSSSGSFLKSAYETAKSYAADTYNAAKHMTEDALSKKL